MINNIPKDWQIKTLGEVCEILDNKRKPINADEREQRLKKAENRFPYYGATGQVGYIDDYLCDFEAILLGEDGAPFLESMKNKAYIVSGKYWVNNHAHILKTKENIANNKFICHFLNILDYTPYVSGTTRLKLNQSSMKQIEIPLPPLETQKAIVEKLENAFAHIDEAVRHLKAVQTNIPRLKSSLLHSAFSGKLTESQNQSNEVQTLKSVVGVEGEFEREEGATSQFKPIHPLIKEEIPQGWEVKTLGEAFKVIGGGTPSTANPKFWSGNIAWITSANIENENFTIIPKKFINQSAIQASATNLVPKNTIIVVTRVGLGKVGITDIETCFSQDSQALLPLMDLNVKFMAFQIKHKAQNFIVSSRGTTINGITKDALKNVALKIPPLETQNQIVQILESKFAHLEKLAQFVNASLENLQRLKSSLLNQAFKGELIC